MRTSNYSLKGHKMNKIFAIFFLTLLLNCAHKPESQTSQSESTTSQCVSSETECSFYDCFEEKKSCGSTGYALGYVKPYCEKFQQQCRLDYDNENVKKWLLGTRYCLQEQMLPILDKIEEYSCSQIKTRGFDSHSYCYIEGAKERKGVGFCDIGVNNIAALGLCIESGDLFSFNGLSQVTSVMTRCLFRFPFGGGLSLNESSFDSLDEVTSGNLENTAENNRKVLQFYIKRFEEKMKK